MKLHTTLLSAAALGTMLLASAPSAYAAYGEVPWETTYRLMAVRSHATVRARLKRVVDTPLAPAQTDAAGKSVYLNPDRLQYGYNNGDETMRRDAAIEIIEVLRTNGDEAFKPGELGIVSWQQRTLAQYPASMQRGDEVLLYLFRRFDDRIVVIGEDRGVIASEDCGGNLSRATDAVREVVSLYDRYEASYGTEPEALIGELQDRLLARATLDGGRISVDAVTEISWHASLFGLHFDGAEKVKLLDLLKQSAPGSEERKRLLHAAGYITLEGAPRVIVDLIGSDASTSTASIGSWALKRYNRADAARMLLDKFAELEIAALSGETGTLFAGQGIRRQDDETPSLFVDVAALDDDRPSNAELNVLYRARVIQALAAVRPQAYMPGESDLRALVTDVLRRNLTKDAPKEIQTEALLAARDMRYTNNELETELKQLVADYRKGDTDETVMKRVIVAFAATRNQGAREYLTSLKGEFSGRFDDHISLCMTLNPFTILVEYK